MTAPERAAYRRAVLEGNFMAMRRAAWTAEQSSKAERLLELCEEAGEDGRKVLVFTFFRDVQDRVQQLLGERFCRRPVRSDVSGDDSLPDLAGIRLVDYDVDWASKNREGILMTWAFYLGGEGAA